MPEPSGKSGPRRVATCSRRMPRSEEARGWWCAVCVCLQGFVAVSREREGGTAVGVESRPASEPGLFLGGGELCFFFRGAWPVLLQEFDWLGSSNRQQKIGSSPEKTKPLQVLATFGGTFFPGWPDCLVAWLRSWPLLITWSPLIAVVAGAGPETSRAGLTGKLGGGGS